MDINGIISEINLHIKNAISNVLPKLNNSGKLISESLMNTVKNHFRFRFPGSTHYNPDKVVSNNDGSINVNVPGVTRAYHDIDIYPVTKNYLTIPIHAFSYGKKASEIPNLFKPKNKNILAINKGNSLVAMFALSKHVHQNRDESLMPSDDTLMQNVSTKLGMYLGRTIGNNI